MHAYIHIFIVCCMYVHVCAYLYVSMRLALFGKFLLQKIYAHMHIHTHTTYHTCTYIFNTSKHMHDIKQYVSCMYMHVSVCICIYLVYILCSISMYLKNYVFACLYKFQLHVCAFIYFYLLEIRCCIG